MSQINYNAYAQSRANQESNSNQGTRVSYFALKNDKDEAVVRIMHDSTDDFDMLITHPVVINGKRKKINCLRNPEDPIANCPYCAAEKQIQSRFYIHMLQYTKNQDGTITVTPVLWDRPASYATDIANKLETYGPLSDSLFKVKRNGAAGSMNTTYSIEYLPPQVANPDLYKKDTKLFEGVKALGTAVLNRNAQQMQEMLAQEPVQKEETVPMPTEAPAPKASDYEPIYTPEEKQYTSTPAAPQPQGFTGPTYETRNVGTPFQNQESGEMTRPRRYY